MVRGPCCNKEGLKRGAWTEEEDDRLREYINEHGDGKWHHLAKHAGLQRCGKSCRLRWINYLRPGIKRGYFSKEEEEMILFHHSRLGNKWSKIVKHLEGRTDNEIKNHYNTRLKRRLKESMQHERVFIPPQPLISSYFATLEAEAKIARQYWLNQLAIATNGNINLDQLGIIMPTFQLNEAATTTSMATYIFAQQLLLSYNSPSLDQQYLLQKSQERQGPVNFNSELIIESGYNNNIVWESSNLIPLERGLVSGTYSDEVEVPPHNTLSSMVNTNDYGAGQYPSDYTSLMDFQEYLSNSTALADTPTLQDWLIDNGEDK